ncbi:MAG TPA: SufE family protein [Opitutaceae bacterium]
MSNASSHSDPLDDLEIVPDPQERLLWIAERGRRATTFTAAERLPAHRVPGCVSAVWLIDESSNTQCRFRGDAESPMLRNLVTLLYQRTSGMSAAEIATDATDIVSRLQLERHLTPTRVNDLRALQTHLRRLAANHLGPTET